MRKKLKKQTTLGRELTKNEIYSVLGIFIVVSAILLNQIYPFGLFVKTIRTMLAPKVKITEEISSTYPSPDPEFDFSDAGTLAEKRLQDPNARIVFNQSTKNGRVNNYWIANLDGSNPKKLNIFRVNTPLNNITYEWIFFVNKQRSISAYSYKTGLIKTITPPQSPGYVSTIFNEYFSPDMNYVTFNVGYITEYCDKYGHSAGCESFMEVPGAKGGVYSYNMNTDKTTYLGNLDYTITANQPRWDEYEDGMYAHQGEKMVKIDLSSGLRIDAPQDVLQQDFFKYLLSPSRKLAYDGEYLLDLANKSRKRLNSLEDAQSGRKSCNWSNWLSNKTLLCYITIGETQDRSKHYYIYNLETGEKKVIVPGDSLENIN